MIIINLAFRGHKKVVVSALSYIIMNFTFFLLRKLKYGISKSNHFLICINELIKNLYLFLHWKEHLIPKHRHVTCTILQSDALLLHNTFFYYTIRI